MGMVAVGGVGWVVGGRGGVAVAGRAARWSLYRAGAAKAGEREVLAWSSFPAPRQLGVLHVGAGAEVPRRGVVRRGEPSLGKGAIITGQVPCMMSLCLGAGDGGERVPAMRRRVLAARDALSQLGDCLVMPPCLVNFVG